MTRLEIATQICAGLVTRMGSTAQDGLVSRSLVLADELMAADAQTPDDTIATLRKKLAAVVKDKEIAEGAQYQLRCDLIDAREANAVRAASDFCVEQKIRGHHDIDA